MRAIKLFIFGIITCSTICLRSQDVEINWGIESKGVNTIGKIEVLGWSGGDYYTMQRKFSSTGSYIFVLEKLSNSLDLVFSKKIELKSYTNTFFKIIDGQIHAFQFELESLRAKELNFAHKIIDLNGTIIDSKIVTTLKDLGKGSGFSICMSPNNNLLGISFVTRKKNEDNNLHHIVVDLVENDNVEIFKTKFSSKGDYAITSIDKSAITNDGSLVSVLQYKSDFIKPSKNELRVSKSSGEFEEPINLEFENQFLGKIDLTAYEDYIMFDGFIFEDTDKKTLTNGFFIAKLDIKLNKVLSLSPFTYTKDFFLSMGYKVKKDGRINFSGSYDLEIYATDNGGYLVADHKGYSKSQINESIIIPFDKNGKLGEKIVLPKKSSAPDDFDMTIGAYGYFGFIENNKFYMIYNGRSVDIKANDMERMVDLKANEKEISTYIATIESDKHIQRKVIINCEEEGGFLIPDKCSKIDGTILINLRRKKKGKYGTLKL